MHRGCVKQLHFLAFLVLFAFACGSINPVDSGLDGTYTLDSVSFESDGISFTLGPPQILGILTLAGSRYNVSLSSLDGPDDVENGTFTSSGNSITFTSDDGSTVTGQVLSGFITFTDSFVNDDGEVVAGTLVFVKS